MTNVRLLINLVDCSAQDGLFGEFMEAWQRGSSNEQDVFSSVLDFIQCCSDSLHLIRNSEDRALARLSPIDEKRILEIEAERNTWKLIYSIYQVPVIGGQAQQLDYHKFSSAGSTAR